MNVPAGAGSKLGRPLWALMMAIAIGLGYALLAPEPGEGPVVDKPLSYWLGAEFDGTAIPEEGELYIQQGQFDGDVYTVSDFKADSIDLKKRQVILSYQLTDLIDQEILVKHHQASKQSWHLRGVDVIGLHLDYQVPWGQLAAYKEWLNVLRLHLSHRSDLVIQGSVDWLKGIPMTALDELGHKVDEVVYPLDPGTLGETSQILKQADHDYKVRYSTAPTEGPALETIMRSSGYKGQIKNP